MTADYVTRAELKAHLDPMRTDIKEIRSDVKSLLGSQAGGQALSAWNKFLLAGVFLPSIAAIATLIWLASGGH